jgi:hypothetical protein
MRVSCNLCDATYQAGHGHKCQPRAAPPTPQAKPAASPPPVSHKPVTNVTNLVSNAANPVNNVTNKKNTTPLTNAADRYLKRLETDRKRSARWRDKNREHYNTYMCGLMRKKRAAMATDNHEVRQ